jgi:hypothetical protein
MAVNMSSLHDTKAKYWQHDLDTDFTVVIPDEDRIDRLLLNSANDHYDMPEISTKPQSFNSYEHFVDIKTVDEFHDSSLFIEPLVDSPVIVDITVVNEDKRLMEALPAAEFNNPVTINTSSVVTQAIDTPTLTESLSKAIPQPIISSTESALHRDNPSSDSAITQPVETREHTDTSENISSLVDNHTNVENVTANPDFLLNNFIAKNQMSDMDTTAPQPVRTELDKRIQTSVTFTSTINETVHDSEWALFKIEQQTVQAQLTQRITQLEKSLRTALFFSLIAAILAGVSLIAAVSGLV